MMAGIYKHYKGDYYQVLGMAAHTETQERMVVYISLDAGRPGPRMRVRPFEMFVETVEWPDGAVRRRFIYIGDEVI